MELASPFVPHGFTASPSWVLAAAFVRSSLRRLSAARLLRFSADKFAAQGQRFFLAAGAFTGLIYVQTLILPHSSI
jgi:hypothetical protein